MSVLRVGLEFKFQHEFEEEYSYLYTNCCWENNDTLKIIYETINCDDEPVFIVINTQDDVLNTAAIKVDGFCLHESPPTEEDIGMTKLMNLFPDGECITLHQAEVIIKAGWREFT